MKKKILVVSVILNIVLLGIVSFEAYYKRASIVKYVNGKYDTIFKTNKNFENSILVFNQTPYQSDVKYLNVDKFDKKVKIAILGNSITFHGIVDGLWGHESGMAASSLEKDYVHLLLNKISEEKQIGIEYIVIQIVDFERNFEQFENARLEIVREFAPEVLIFQIGENISTEKLITKGEIFEKNYVELIEYCKGKNTIICLPFWATKEKLELITEVALKSESYLVDLSHLGNGMEPLNFAKSENKYEHAGVAAHPGDYGMENIAKMLYITVNKVIEKDRKNCR